MKLDSILLVEGGGKSAELLTNIFSRMGAKVTLVTDVAELAFALDEGGEEYSFALMCYDMYKKHYTMLQRYLDMKGVPHVIYTDNNKALNQKAKMTTKLCRRETLVGMSLLSKIQNAINDSKTKTRTITKSN